MARIAPAGVATDRQVVDRVERWHVEIRGWRSRRRSCRPVPHGGYCHAADRDEGNDMDGDGIRRSEPTLISLRE
jgi:hypothetical protein